MEMVVHAEHSICFYLWFGDCICKFLFSRHFIQICCLEIAFQFFLFFFFYDFTFFVCCAYALFLIFITILLHVSPKSQFFVANQKKLKFVSFHYSYLASV